MTIEGLTMALLLGLAGVGGWLLVRLVLRAEREARQRAQQRIDEARDEEADATLDEVDLAEHFAEELLSLPLVVPAPSVGGATTWMMNQGPAQFGLMPEPHAVKRLVEDLEVVVRVQDVAAREKLVAAAVEVLLRSIEWRNAEEVHHLLIHILGELGDEHTLPVLDGLAAERAFDQEEKKAMVRARSRVEERLDARRGRLAVSDEGGELAFSHRQDH